MRGARAFQSTGLELLKLFQKMLGPCFKNRRASRRVRIDLRPVDVGCNVTFADPGAVQHVDIRSEA